MLNPVLVSCGNLHESSQKLVQREEINSVPGELNLIAFIAAPGNGSVDLSHLLQLRGMGQLTMLQLKLVTFPGKKC